MKVQQIIDNFINENKGKPKPGTSKYSINSVHFTEEYRAARAKQLGWINGYKWGVEYPTNGNKPDLPDGTLCLVRNKERKEWYDEPETSSAWPVIDAFRIVDDRFKPADEKPVVNQQVADEWWDYETDKAIALPPVDAECLAYYDDGRECWHHCTVIGKSPFKDLYMAAALKGRHERKLIWAVKFKPIDHATRKAEAERKRVVDAFVAEFSNSQSESFYLTIQSMYDKGYLRMPEGK